MEEKKCSVLLENKSRLSLTGILEIKSFQETAAEFDTCQGPLQITGENIHMERLDLDTGEVELKGVFISLYYPAIDQAKPRSFWGKLLG
ncbi:MAG: sporulation protein YabP [Ruminococcaceae bacterium]|nr:sporulation protein YabP [Oscillospiraceae bacterium]